MHGCAEVVCLLSKIACICQDTGAAGRWRRVCDLYGDWCCARPNMLLCRTWCTTCECDDIG